MGGAFLSLLTSAFASISGEEVGARVLAALFVTAWKCSAPRSAARSPNRDRQLPTRITEFRDPRANGSRRFLRVNWTLPVLPTPLKSPVSHVDSTDR